MQTTRSSGTTAENLALNYLQKRGLSLVTKNYSCRCGEIDLIMQDSGALVFIEVRYRKSTRFGLPEETVDSRKQRKLILTAQRYLQSAQIDAECRFDVIAISEKRPIKWTRIQLTSATDGLIPKNT
ncbi:YraN family protein [Solemya velum gill symbiont]|uniref:YraN family protein n=2 Tax=Solemya velum gill symbiont TaxID=2340 RepID=UPI0009969331|nr:YraN family protein [Solemya velum gill symbiont]OOY53000.1 YraN family protein [Solemya velum gill symbiont]OOY56771.1 YraN family protein [Solemya velum gill symbiont]OOY58118.1 YraN family protein [Solemya velum gill symbiont]OOY60959.1 YraN family protein [Solemya velum gill symbiont]OOY63212.1 YraN family protein [Solemya velum gill symbiont]